MQTSNAYKNYENIQRLDTLHTYAEWKRIENRRKARKRANAAYYIKQKFAGLTLAVIGVLIPILLDGDATASVLILPLGKYTERNTVKTLFRNLFRKVTRSRRL